MIIRIFAEITYKTFDAFAFDLKRQIQQFDRSRFVFGSFHACFWPFSLDAFTRYENVFFLNILKCCTYSINFRLSESEIEMNQIWKFIFGLIDNQKWCNYHKIMRDFMRSKFVNKLLLRKSHRILLDFKEKKKHMNVLHSISHPIYRKKFSESFDNFNLFINRLNLLLLHYKW